MKEMINELEKRINEKAVKEFGVNYGWAEAMGVREISGRKILPIAVYKNRDHGVDASVVRIEFYEVEASPEHLRTVDLEYNRPSRRFYYVFPSIKLIEISGKLEAEIEIINSQYVGFQLPFGNRYSREILGRITEKLSMGKR